MKKTILTILVCGVMVMGLTGCGIFEEKYEHKYTEDVYDIEVTPKTIYETYDNNILDGNKKYFGKRLKITSTFRDVSDGELSGLMLYLDKVYCSSFNTEEDASSLSELDKGQEVTVIGTADEWIANSLNLKDCQIYEY